MLRKISSLFNNFIKRLADSNKKQYGSNNPDCCGNPKKETHNKLKS